MNDTDLAEVRHAHQLRSLRLQSVLRVGVVALMIGAMRVGIPRAAWSGPSVLLGFYAFVAVSAAIFAFSQRGTSVMGQVPLFVMALIDVAALFIFQLLSHGGYVPLLVMALLPLMVSLEVWWRRAAVVLACTFMAFAVYMIGDPEIELRLGWVETAFLVVMYGFLCSASFLVVYVQGRHVDEITSLSASREELLAQTMTASEEERRRVSESIHDGPLQDVLVARQEILEFAKTSQGEELDRAMACLRDSVRRPSSFIPLF
jgi:two-component system NarL family sensor kinase